MSLGPLYEGCGTTNNPCTCRGGARSEGGAPSWDPAVNDTQISRALQGYMYFAHKDAHRRWVLQGYLAHKKTPAPYRDTPLIRNRAPQA